MRPNMDVMLVIALFSEIVLLTTQYLVTKTENYLQKKL